MRGFTPASGFCMRGFTLGMVFLIFFYSGCASFQEPSPSAPPLSFPPPTMGEEKGRDDAPRRMASLHLTEKGKGELEHGELKKAMDRFEKAIGLDAQNSTAYFFFAEARFQQKEYRQSLALLERAEGLLPGNPEWLVKVYLLQGRNYEALGNKSEASKKYQKALEIDPGQAEALERLK
jgi:tetratricopeptide (TPR) repeat protein